MRIARVLPILLISLLFGTGINAAPAADGAISPAEAQRAINVLQDSQRRAEVVATLKALADDDTAPAQSDAETPADAAAEAPAPEPEPAAIVPLEEDGLIARTIRQVGAWVDGLGRQVQQVRRAAQDLPEWWRASFDNETGRQQLWSVLLGLGLVFLIGLAVEWGIHRVLAIPRRKLVSAAEKADTDAMVRAQKSAAMQSSPTQPEPNPQTAGGTRPSSENVALVQTSKDGVERIEAIPIEPAAAPEPAPVAEEPKPLPQHYETETRRHISSVRRLPYAAAALLIDLLPLAFFFAAAVLTIRSYASGNVVTSVLGDFVNAYITTRVTMAVVRLLVSPRARSLQMIPASQRLGEILERWIRRFVATTTFGMALAEAVHLLGEGYENRMLVLKTISLLVHIYAVILIFQIRRPVAEMIRAPSDATGAWAGARNWLAQIWPVFAAAAVLGGWLVWAMGVDDGFPKLINFLAISGAVLVGGQVTAILVQGALGRLFHSDPRPDNDTAASISLAHYYPVARGLASILIAVGTVVALFQAWGFNAIGWFAEGTIGRSLASASTTILIAAVGAVLVWQWANLSVNRRLRDWTQRGDLLRAARLRTLLPMLRTGLFIIIALIVVLTTLNQIGINTTPLLAGASIIGVALGFGSQKLVQDFITGIFLLMENAMQVGDWVTVAGVSGTVEYLSIRTVRLRAGDGSLHIVPFSSVSTVNNTNRGIGNAAIRISVGYETDVEQVINELKQIGVGLRHDPAFKDLILNDIEVWGVDSVDGSMVTLAGQIRCIDKGRWGVQREINRRILERFRELGIEIANPRASLLLPTEGMYPGRETPA
jgi:small-conductance mechanosensitive channel